MSDLKKHVQWIRFIETITMSINITSCFHSFVAEEWFALHVCGDRRVSEAKNGWGNVPPIADMLFKVVSPFTTHLGDFQRNTIRCYLAQQRQIVGRSLPFAPLRLHAA